MLRKLNEKFETDIKKNERYVVIDGRILSDNESACRVEIAELNKRCKDCKIDMFGHKGSVENARIDHKEGQRKAQFTIRIKLYE